MAAEALLDAFINANVLFCLAFGLWTCLGWLADRAGLARDAGHDLHLLNTVFLAVLLAPAAGLGLGLLQGMGLAPRLHVTLSDIVVSRYLQGGIDISAREMERLLVARDTFTVDLLSGSGFVAQVLIALFATGLLLGLGRLALSVACLLRVLSQSFLWRRIGRVHLHLCDRTLVPFSTRGLRNYYVVIPSHMLGRPQELKAALAHELQHIRQGDLEWEVALEALKPFFYVNPAFHAWKRRVEALRELHCDRAVLSRGQIDPGTYCGTLISVCQQSLERKRSLVTLVPKVTLVSADRGTVRKTSLSFVETRIRSLLSKPGRAMPRAARIGCCLLLTTAVLGASLAMQRPGDWSQDRLTLSTVVNLERLAEINRTAQFGRIDY